MNWYHEPSDSARQTRVQYTVQEIAVDRYESQTNGKMSEGFSLINWHEPDLVSILGAKTWEDNDNAAGLRPESIRIRLRAKVTDDTDNSTDWTDVSGRSVDASDDWKWDFARMPKFEDGKEIAYSISEDDIEKYETTYEGYNVTNTYHPDITSIKVTKVWNDSNNADGVRPDSVTVRLYADSVDAELAFTLSAANKTDDNTWVFEDTDLSLPATKEGHVISYVLKEDDVDGYTSGVRGDITTGFVVTNTHVVIPKPDPDPTPDPDPDPTPDPTLYTITYVLNGGIYDGSTDDIVETYPAGTGILIHEAPTREGYAFDYWKGSEYQSGDAYTVTEDHTFVAQWKPNGGGAPKSGSEGTPDAETDDGPSSPSGSTATPPAVGTGRTTSSTALASTGDDSTLALASVVIALLGACTIALALRCR